MLIEDVMQPLEVFGGTATNALRVELCEQWEVIGQVRPPSFLRDPLHHLLEFLRGLSVEIDEIHGEDGARN